MKKVILLSVFLLSFTQVMAADIYWYLAASMTKPGKELVKNFNASGNDHVYLILGGSGQILNKLIASGKGDIYTPASEAFMKKAEAHGIVKEKRLLLEQTPVFGVSKDASNRIRSFDDLLKASVQIATGNPRTMALGKTYLKIEKKMPSSVAAQIRNKTIIKAVNVSQIVNYLKTGAIGAGTIFDSVARANRMAYIEIPDRYNVKVRAFFMKLTTGKSPKAVEDFEAYVFSHAAVFEKYGFKLEK